MLKTALFSCLVCLLTATAVAQQPAAAQQPAVAQKPAATPGTPCALTFDNGSAEGGQTIERNHWQFRGKAELQPPCAGVRFFADLIDVYPDDHRIVATGNVVFTNQEGRIAANAIDFNLETGLGTFHDATGVMSLGAKADRKQFGNQDPDVFFWGQTIEKKGPQKYQISEGGFTTCVQPTPRWAVGSASVDLNLNDYAIARNMVLRVKGVPLLYLPVIYYPIQNDDRATGFLLPTYGTSTYRGQSLSNAFFWAIGRSQDATFFHDWFTRRGQGAGAEYRYVASAQSFGNARYYLLNEHETTDVTTGNTVAASRYYEVTGNVTHVLTPRLRARARVDYVSNLITQQLYNQNVYRATNPIRTIDANLSGAWGGLSTNASYQRTEVFTSTTPERSFLYGGTPRVTTSLAPRQMRGIPIYAGLTSEFAHLPYRQLQDEKVTLDNSLNRFDLVPTARLPLSTLPFLTVNTSASYRTTYYSRSFDSKNLIVDQPLTRRYLSLKTTVIGPVLAKIWDTPDRALSQRMKHVIEPTFTVDYYSDVSNYQATPVLTDGSDKVIGGMAQYTYGLNNRLFYRSRPTDAARAYTREFVTIGVQQTYYTKPEASLTDTQYSSAHPVAMAFSPVALTGRFSPTTLLDANARAEYDVAGGEGLQLLSVGSSITNGATTSNVTFSRSRATRRTTPSSYLNGSTNLAFRQNRFHTLYSLSWDIARRYIVQQRISQSYLAQCCGFEMEFQNFNYPAGAGYPIARDRRMNFSFILAGLGTFSNFFGAFGGQR